MTLIGLTGPCCAGKNLAASVFAEAGIPVLDVDKLGHQALDLEIGRVRQVFGSKYTETGHVNRRLLGDLVFSDSKKRRQLEEIVHPRVNLLAEEWILEQKTSICVINAALLHKMALYLRLDMTVFVCAPAGLRLFRAMRRDNLSFRQAFLRLASQREIKLNSTPPSTDIYYIHNWGLGSRARLGRRIEKILAAAGLRQR